jgi:glycosyltransferase involved in cell wall biosynthesis
MDWLNVEKVSVIIPYFNKVTTIHRAVKSVLDQTYTHWEIIIVDDCSELPLAMHADWVEHPVTILRNAVNRGPGPSRQFGMDGATGNYLSFLDADDWWGPSFLEKSLAVHRSRPDVAATWVQSQTMFKGGLTTIRQYSHIPFATIRETILQYSRPWQTGSLVWKKACCGSWGELSTNQDYWFEFSSSLKNNSVQQIPEVLYFVDQTTGTHRVDLVKQDRYRMNQFDLFCFVHQQLRDQFNLRCRILLLHRQIRALFKVTELKAPELIREGWERMEKMVPFTRLFFRQKTALKLLHKLLQRTPYRIHF